MILVTWPVGPSVVVYKKIPFISSHFEFRTDITLNEEDQNYLENTPVKGVNEVIEI